MKTSGVLLTMAVMLALQAPFLMAAGGPVDLKIEWYDPNGRHDIPLICFEVLFADLAREHVDQGAGLLVNLSNDGWVAGTGGPEQHLAAAVLRAIELRRPLLRATTTGISAAIDPAGRVVAVLPENRAGRLLLDVRPGRRSSFYARWGDVVGWVALASAVIITATDARSVRRRSRTNPARAKLPGAPG